MLMSSWSSVKSVAKKNYYISVIPLVFKLTYILYRYLSNRFSRNKQERYNEEVSPAKSFVSRPIDCIWFWSILVYVNYIGGKYFYHCSRRNLLYFNSQVYEFEISLSDLDYKWTIHDVATLGTFINCFFRISKLHFTLNDIMWRNAVHISKEQVVAGQHTCIYIP